MSASPAHPPPLPQKVDANHRLLGILIALEMLLGAIWFVVLTSTPLTDWGYPALPLFVVLCPVCLILMGIAVHSMRTYPANRTIALVLLLVPLVGLVAPMLVNSMAGGGPALRSPGQIRTTVLVLVLAPIAFALVRPRKVARFLPEFLLRSFWLNLLILCVPILSAAAFGVALAQWSTHFAEASPDQAGWVIYYGLIAAWFFAAATILPATLIVLYSYLGLFQSRVRDCHRLRIAQLVLSLPAALLGVWVLFRIITDGSGTP